MINTYNAQPPSFSSKIRMSYDSAKRFNHDFGQQEKIDMKKDINKLKKNKNKDIVDLCIVDSDSPRIKMTVIEQTNDEIKRGESFRRLSYFNLVNMYKEAKASMEPETPSTSSQDFIEYVV